jgi:hypothetical protein
VTLTSQNVRSLVLAGDVLLDRGVSELVADGVSVALVDGPIEIGPQVGKREDVYGPFNQVFHRPFCFAYPDDGPDVFRQYAAYLLSAWSYRGNGHGCALPLSAVSAELLSERNVVYVGVPRDQVPLDDALGFDWTYEAFVVDGASYGDAAAAFVFPNSERLGAVLTATEGDEYLLFRLQPFVSQFALPDYLIWSEGGGRAAGFFDAEWAFDAALGFGE